jgi:polyisoprenoid-binding protein YceI
MNEYSLRPDWLDAARHPIMRYVGAIEFDDARPAVVVGELRRAEFGMIQYADGELGRIRLRIQVEANPAEDPL